MYEAQVQIPALYRVVVYSCHPSRVVARRSAIQSHPWLQNELEASLYYNRPCVENAFKGEYVFLYSLTLSLDVV